MDCPHCGVENLLGAKICVACGKPTLGAPPPRVADPFPAEPEPRAEASASRTQICRVCMEAFEGDPSEEMAICPTCRGFESGASSAPARRDAPPDAEALSTYGAAPDPKRRPKPVERRTNLRTGPIAAIIGLVICLAGVAVVRYVRRDNDPSASYEGSLQRDAAAFTLAPSKDGYVRLETTLSLGLRHERLRANFSDGMDTALELRQKSVQTLDVAFSNDDDRGAVFDTISTCRVTQQSGTSGGGDARDARIYPWVCADYHARAVVPSDGPTRNAEGVPAVPGRDVPPCFTVREIAAPSGDVAPGTKWKASLVLPLAATRDGALCPAPFGCDLTYAGKIVRDGVSTLLVTVRGTSLQRPGDVVDDMNKASATIDGVLFFDAKTGLVHEAHLTAEVALWEEHSRVEDRVHVNGTLDVVRK